MCTEIPRKSFLELNSAWCQNAGRYFPWKCAGKRPCPSAFCAAHRKKVSSCFIPKWVWSVVNESLEKVIQTSPLVFFSVFSFCLADHLALAAAGFEMQHDAAVNHVCMSKQLCQAEAECPLLVRPRSGDESEGLITSKTRGGYRQHSDKHQKIQFLKEYGNNSITLWYLKAAVIRYRAAFNSAPLMQLFFFPTPCANSLWEWYPGHKPILCVILVFILFIYTRSYPM